MEKNKPDLATIKASYQRHSDMGVHRDECSCRANILAMVEYCEELKALSDHDHQHYVEIIHQLEQKYQKLEKKALQLVEEAGIYRTSLLGIIGCFGEQNIQQIARLALSAGAKANPLSTPLD